MAAKLTYLYDLASAISSTLTVDQIVSTMVFGSTPVGVYDGTHVYQKDELATYIDSNGGIHVLRCILDGATGEPIELDDWEEFSLLNAIDNTSGNLIMMAELQPSEASNKVWLQFRGGQGGIPEGNRGLIVKRNFIISRTAPDPFTTDLVWGMVQSSL